MRKTLYTQDRAASVDNWTLICASRAQSRSQIYVGIYSAVLPPEVVSQCRGGVVDPVVLLEVVSHSSDANVLARLQTDMITLPMNHGVLLCS